MINELYSFLATLGFNEPLHSPITHMPIGLAVGALIFFIVGLVFKRNNLFLTARHVSILAFIFVFPTILLGVFDWIHYYHAALFFPIKVKIALASLALVLLGAGIILGGEVKPNSTAMLVIYAATCISMMGLGYFGAGIIYGRGLEMEISKPESVAAGTDHIAQDTGRSPVNQSPAKGNASPEWP